MKKSPHKISLMYQIIMIIFIIKKISTAHLTYLDPLIWKKPIKIIPQQFNQREKILNLVLQPKVIRNLKLKIVIKTINNLMSLRFSLNYMKLFLSKIHLDHLKFQLKNKDFIIKFRKIVDEHYCFIQFKSDSVFVGKKPIRSCRNSNQNKNHLLDLLIQKGNGNSLIFNKQQKQKTQKYLTQLTLYSPKKKLWVNDIRIQNKKSFSPQLKSKTIFPQYSTIQRLESLSAVKPLSKTTLYPCSQFKKGKKEDNQFALKKKLSQNYQHLFSKNMRLNESIGPYETRYNTGKKRRCIF